MSLFELRGTLKPLTSTILGVSGFLLLVLIWFLVTAGANPVVSSGILPSPGQVLRAFVDLYNDNEVIRNTCLSLGLNIAGYVEAIVISIPLGFAIGLFPFFRGLFQRPVDAIRYVPLTAVTGLFIIWFGLGTGMKVHFLAFGILIYLLPIVVQRIDEVQDVYLKTVYTLGANPWQTIRSVYIPSVISRLSDDIRVLTAISWTYIIVAEGFGSQGGLGALIWRAGQRQGRVDKVFALLIIIILIGLLQDKIFQKLDKEFFPHKYQSKVKYGKIEKDSTFEMLLNFALDILIWLALAIYVVFLINEFVPFITDQGLLTHLFGDTAPLIHIIVLGVIIYKIKNLIVKRQTATPVVT